MTEAWVQRYGSEAGTDDRASKVVADAAGNVIVVGSTGILKYSGAGVLLWTNRDNGAATVAVDANGSVFVMGNSAIKKYSGTGVPLWTNYYRGDASSMGVDASGNLFVTGSLGSPESRSTDYVTSKYSGAGVLLWTSRYNGPSSSQDFAKALAVDAGGNVYVTGSSDSRPLGYDTGPNYDYVTIKYSGTGVLLWAKRYNGPVNGHDDPYAVAVDGSGNVFVTGSSDGSGGQYSYATIAYSGAGVPLWTNRFKGSASSYDAAFAVAADAGGNVFVTGNSGSGGTWDYATIAYSGAGVPLWTNRYDGPANGYDQATALAVNTSGNVFVTGSSPDSDGYYHYATIAYSGAGVALWTNRYSGTASGHDRTTGLAVDGSGNVFVSGSSPGSGGDSDYATIAYSGAGMALWTNRYNDGRVETSDTANALAVDSSGNVFVTGNSASAGSGANATIAYSKSGVPLWTKEAGGTAIAVDGSGKVFVTGSATIAYSSAGLPLWTNNTGGAAIATDASGRVFVTGSATIAYSATGDPLWTNHFNGEARAIAVDGSGNVFATGPSSGGDGELDYATIATIKYSGGGVPLWTNGYPARSSVVAVDRTGNAFVAAGSSGEGVSATIAYSGLGVPMWTNHYSGPENWNNQATAVAVDADGNVFVTGSSGGDYATIAYSGTGMPLWTNRYNGPANGHDRASAVAVDGRGNVIVAGSSADSGGNSDYVTIAYSGAGVPLWTNRYDGPGKGFDSPQTKSCLAVGSDGAVYVTGASEGLFSTDFATVKYVWQNELAIQLRSTVPPELNLTLSGAPNSSWTIERASMLTGPWTNLTPLLIGTRGSAGFQTTNSPHPTGFYRARQQ